MERFELAGRHFIVRERDLVMPACEHRSPLIS